MKEGNGRRRVCEKEKRVPSQSRISLFCAAQDIFGWTPRQIQRRLRCLMSREIAPPDIDEIIGTRRKAYKKMQGKEIAK